MLSAEIENQGLEVENHAQNSNDRLIDKAEVSRLIGFKRSWIDNKRRAGEFPAPIMLGRRCRWLKSTILNWIKTQATA